MEEEKIVASNNTDINSNTRTRAIDIELKKERLLDLDARLSKSSRDIFFLTFAITVITIVWGVTILSDWSYEVEQSTGVVVPSIATAVTTDRAGVEQRFNSTFPETEVRNPFVRALYSVMPSPPEVDVNGNVIDYENADLTPNTSSDVTSFYFLISGLGIALIISFVEVIVVIIRQIKISSNAYCVNCNHPLHRHIKHFTWAGTGCQHTSSKAPVGIKKKWYNMFKSYKCSCTFYDEDPTAKPRRIALINLVYIGLIAIVCTALIVSFLT